MKVILTGSSGFLGTIINKLFKGQVLSLGRSSATIICDLSREIPSLPSADTIIHAAGKAHSVPKTSQEKQEFFDVNVNGTANLLKGLEQAPSLPRSFIFISSVAVYGAEEGIDIPESHSLNAKNPYGLSKIQAEEMIKEWCEKNKVICGILRLPLLVGENPPGNLGAMIKGIKKGYYFNIAGGLAKKSMVLATDVAHIIPKLAEVGGIYNLTDGHHPNFSELSNVIAQRNNKRTPKNIPYPIAKLMARIGDFFGQFPINSDKLRKITSDLTFDDSKAVKYLNWRPGSVLNFYKEATESTSIYK